jgi:hypothetical protein
MYNPRSSSTDVKNAWSYTPSLPYVFIPQEKLITSTVPNPACLSTVIRLALYLFHEADFRLPCQTQVTVTNVDYC